MTLLALLIGAIDTSLVGPIMNVGAVGSCLILLAIYYVRKDKKYETRVDEMREMEKAFRRELADLQERFRKEQGDVTERYRQALEKFSQTLDAVIAMLKNRKNN